MTPDSQLCYDGSNLNYILFWLVIASPECVIHILRTQSPESTNHVLLIYYLHFQVYVDQFSVKRYISLPGKAVCVCRGEHINVLQVQTPRHSHLTSVLPWSLHTIIIQLIISADYKGVKPQDTFQQHLSQESFALYLYTPYRKIPFCLLVISNYA